MKNRPTNGLMITLPADLVEAIEKYNAVNWPVPDGGVTAGSIGSLNAVAFIGERVAAIVAVKTRGGK